MSFSRGDSRQPFVYIKTEDTIGVPCFWVDREYSDHHDFIHDEQRSRIRHLRLGHYNPVTQFESYGFLWLNQREREYYPITIGDERLLEHYFNGTRIPKLLTRDIYSKLLLQLGVYESRINKKTSQGSSFVGRMGLFYIPHTSWILKGAMETENYIQNPFWWQKRALWQNFIKFTKK